MAELPARRRLREREAVHSHRPSTLGSGSGAALSTASSSGLSRVSPIETSLADAPAADEVWRTFGTETEAGRLLRRLYATGQKPQVAYPPVHTRAMQPDARRPFVPGGGRPEEDPRIAKTAKVELDVPAPRSAAAHVRRPHAVDMIPKRKPGELIQQELRVREEEISNFRPLPRPAVTTEGTKRRLQNQFALKGGKALPEELTMAPIPGEIPLSLQTGKPRARPPPGHGSHSPTVAARGEEDRLFEAVAGEVREREEYLSRMRGLGALTQEEERIVGREIDERVKDMQRLDEMIRRREVRGGGVRGGPSHGQAGLRDGDDDAEVAYSHEHAQARGTAGYSAGRGGPTVVVYHEDDDDA